MSAGSRPAVLPLNYGHTQTHTLVKWSRWQVSNLRPRAPETRALPAALHRDRREAGSRGWTRSTDPRLIKTVLYQLSYARTETKQVAPRRGLEPRTSRLTAGRSTYRAIGEREIEHRRTWRTWKDSNLRTGSSPAICFPSSAVGPLRHTSFGIFEIWRMRKDCSLRSAFGPRLRRVQLASLVERTRVSARRRPSAFEAAPLDRSGTLPMNTFVAQARGLEPRHRTGVRSFCFQGRGLTVRPHLHSSRRHRQPQSTPLPHTHDRGASCTIRTCGLRFRRPALLIQLS